MKVLMLGGSYFQVPAIQTAKRMGHYVITCDYLPDNPGHKFADEYHNVSTTDKEAVLKLAKKLKIDGIVCYASDPAAVPTAYVAEQLGLPGNPLKSVEILANKDLFRKFLLDNGFNSPKADFSTLPYHCYLPVVVKPTDSSGSKGITIVKDSDNIMDAIDYALKFSRNGRYIIEEFVEKDGYQIAGDGFVVNGKLVFTCFANEHFEPDCLVPIGESFPYNRPRLATKVHDEIQRLLTLLKMKNGALNFDIRIQGDKVFLMEIGPRNGGNLIAQVTEYATGVDMVEYTIKVALGEDCSDLKMVEPKGFWSCYMVHSQTEGILQEVIIDKEFRKNNLVEFEMFFGKGDKVVAFRGSNGTLGTMILNFSTMDDMLKKMNNMGRWVKVIV